MRAIEDEEARPASRPPGPDTFPPGDGEAMTTESTATPTAQRAARLRTGLTSVDRALSPLSLKWFGWAIAATPALITA
jgi:hypothetical protein